MDALREYARRCWPGRWTVAGIRLAPYTLGHAILRATLEDPAGPGTLAAHLWVCSRPWHRAARGMDGWWARWWICGTARKLILTDCAAAMSWFAVYLQAEGKGPRLSGGGDGRPSGAPWELIVKNVLMGPLGHTERAAMDLPMGQALWEAAAWLESQDSLEIQNQIEDDLIAAAKAHVKQHGAQG